MPIGRTDQPPAEQGGRDFKVGCLLFPAIEASQHMAKAPAPGRVQSGIGKVLPVDRADESLNRLKSILRHLIERNDRGERLARLSVTEKRQLRTAQRRPHVKADLVMQAGGKRDVGSASPGAQARRNLDKVDDPRVDLRRPIDGLLDCGLIRPGCETANPIACATRASL